MPALNDVDMPFVPVVSFWSQETSISMEELRAAANGTSSKFQALIVPVGDSEELASFFGVTALPNGPESVEEIEGAVKDGVLGLLRATDVSPRVHALAIDGVSLFGNDRISNVAEWPLIANVQATTAWDQAASWTLVAGGDIMLDRGVAYETTILGKGADYLFDGGTARITRIRCCSVFDYPYPLTERTGNSGAVRALFREADVAMANLESAVLVNAPFHERGFTFTADAKLLDGVDNAGFDFLSLANNHSRNGGARGIITAIEELDARGIANAGAGADETEAAKPAYLEVNGIRLAIISCDRIAGSYWAMRGHVGTESCKLGRVTETIRAAREQADVVIVFPHWGIEYNPRPAAYQKALAAEWIGAGADMVIGAHSHVAGAMDDIDGHVVFYSMGNLIFDQDFRQSTMMGVVPEMTFNGSELIQIELHATLIIDAQPNLVGPADASFVIDQMHDASQGLLDY